jgi:predicted phosphate transport protein (TIGR00153 family)
MVRLIPRDEEFTKIFIRDGENLLAAARALEELVVTYDRLDERVAAIQALEHQGDEIDAEIAGRLERAFITPFDREDIHELTSRLDDVVDGIQEVAETFVIYGIVEPTPEARQLAGIIAGQGAELIAALRMLDKPETMQAHLREVHTLENKADGLSRAAIGRLFRERMDPLDVIRFRDLYIALEETIDAAEDAAEVLERIIAKGG